jgi:hypothetical protein
MGLFLPRSFVARHAWAAEQRKQQRRGELKRHATQAIQQAYKEHLFTIDVDEHFNVVIDHPLLRHAKARYFIPGAIYNEGTLLRMCGEILERANVKRGELKYFEQYDDADGLAQTQFSSR